MKNAFILVGLITSSLALGQTAPVPAQPTLLQTPLLPQAGETFRLSLVVPAGTTAANAPELSLRGAQNFQRNVKAARVTGTVATYEVSLPQNGFYDVQVAGQPAQRIRVGTDKDRLQSPILSLNFDGPAPLADLSGFGHDGKAIGTVKFPAGKVGKGLAFENEQSYVEFARTAALETPTQQLTMSIWVKPNDERGYSDFFTKGDWNVIKTDAKNGSIDFFTGGWRRGENEVAQPKDWVGQWHHLVGVVQGDTSRLYIDGKLVKEIDVEGELKPTAFPWNLGRNAEEPKGRGFSGTLDDVRIYPFALTTNEVETLYRTSGTAATAPTNAAAPAPAPATPQSASATAAQAAPTAPANAAPQTQPTLSQLPLLPKTGEKVTFSLVLPNGTATSQAPTLEISGAAGFKQSLKALAVTEGVARYEVTFNKNGFYDLRVPNQPVQRIKVGAERSPILSLNFDGPAPLADLSGFGHDGKAIGTVKFPAGKVGKGLAFENEQSYVEFARTAALETPTQQLTMSIWVKPNDERGYSDFFTKGDWNVIKTDSKSGAVRYFTGGWRRGGPKVPQPENWDGQWHHVVGVTDGQDGYLYIDGKLIQESEWTGTLKYTAFPWNLGRNAEEPKGRGFKGVLDDVRIYPVALNAQEVADLYRAGQK